MTLFLVVTVTNIVLFPFGIPILSNFIWFPPLPFTGSTCPSAFIPSSFCNSSSCSSVESVELLSMLSYWSISSDVTFPLYH